MFWILYRKNGRQRNIFVCRTPPRRTGHGRPAQAFGREPVDFHRSLREVVDRACNSRALPPQPGQHRFPRSLQPVGPGRYRARAALSLAIAGGQVRITAADFNRLRGRRVGMQ